METLIITPPDTYPITLASLKRSLRISWADDDADIADDIAAATDFVEHGLGRKLITQTLQVATYIPDLLMTPLAGVIGSFEGYATPIPWAPIQAVNLVEIETQIGTWSPLTTPDDYLVDVPGSMPGHIYLSTSALAKWSVALNYPGNRPRIRITYVAGYGDDESAVPAVIRRNIRQVAAWMYENRDAASPPDSILDLSYKVWRL